ncbi:MAG: fimbrial assembly protein [Okeania sp. SIO3H1]|uniref:PilN domain-containing protein n=1 Tax=Okeania sp. SIO1I7 TaxID=2607772 RepID=UPI0013CA5F61|nr:PilN domain-containing protein [Okeania sp. SIO1I7]NEN92632.1 fimbrial assembly protein [Okeania sp. SIO3H1]NET29380.1 fimbrial assembly protein [Okeania sp. SIO1I7]
MYGLDVNFLNDRPEYKKDIPKPVSSGPSLEDPRPILIGAAVAVAVNGLVAGGWFYLNQVNTKLQADLDKLNAELSKLNAQVKDIEAIKEKTKTFKAEAKALATVFDQIKPWSALLGEFGTLIPSGVKIASIEQKEPKIVAPAAPPPNAQNGDKKEEAAAPPKPTANVSFSGTADSYGQVNDFLLLLQNSPFFQGEKTKLISATKKANPTRLELQESRSTLAPDIPELPQVVEYKIETNLSPLGASELLPQLKSQGAIGLVDRIEILTEKGVF